MSEFSDKRKKEYIDTALKLFAGKGYDGTSIEDLAKAMGLTKGSFYHHFRSKEEMLTELAKHIAKEMVLHLQESVQKEDGNIVEKINRLIEDMQLYRKKAGAKRRAVFAALLSEKNSLLKKEISETYIKMAGPLIQAY